MDDRTCLMDGCLKDRRARGYCKNHHRALLASGELELISLQVPSDLSLRQRFYHYCDVRGPDECWEWKASTSQDGYGQLAVNRKRLLAHRVSYMIHHPLTDLGRSMHVCHACDNPPCCNPYHLWLGTARDNTMDSLSKGRWQVGVQRKNAKLNDAAVIEILSSPMSARALARKYGVAPHTVNQVRDGVSWRHVSRPA